jgi:hypothetical protein
MANVYVRIQPLVLLQQLLPQQQRISKYLPRQQQAHAQPLYSGGWPVGTEFAQGYYLSTVR